MNKTAPTGKIPMNHSVQVMSIFAVCLTSDSASKFGAKPVRNMELVRHVVANAVHIMYAPILRAVGPGSEPYSGGMFLITGNIVPPLRAVLDGVHGASTRSASATG